MNTQNPIRLEFKIYATNSDWLHYDNLKGDCIQIMNRYTALGMRMTLPTTTNDITN
jgi:hypothetical protein